MRRILHISDVHFGPPHLPDRTAGVLELVRERRPHLVVLSGDLTQRARPEQFRQARAFVVAVGVPTISVPGNHDVPLYRVWERLFSPYGAYRKHFSPELEPVFEDEELLAVGINTAHGLTWTEGRITRRRLAEVERIFARAPEALCKIVVAHHHFIPPPRFGSQRVLRRGAEAIDVFSSVGVDLILSGHHHQAFIGNSEEFYPKGRLPVVILHSGTTTSSRGRGGEKKVNSCNWIEVDERTILASHLRWHERLGRFVEHSRHLYPRQEVEPYTLEAAIGPARTVEAAD